LMFIPLRERVSNSHPLTLKEGGLERAQ